MAKVEVDAGKAEKKVWLVKVPNFVAEKWHAACLQSANSGEAVGAEIGKVTMERPVGAEPPRCTLKMSDNIVGVPREYNMRQGAGDASSIYSFSEEPDLISVMGKVDQRYDVEMRLGTSGQAATELDPEYRRLSRERNRAANTKTRTAQVIAPQSVSKHNSVQAARAYSSYSAGNKRKPEVRGEKRIIEKRVRMDKDPLEKLIFRLFEKQDFWPFQQLVKETDQPVAWLKECLLEVAVQNKSPGLHRDQWQLKPEYRTREPPTDS